MLAGSPPSSPPAAVPLTRAASGAARSWPSAGSTAFQAWEAAASSGVDAASGSTRTGTRPLAALTLNVEATFKNANPRIR